MKFQALKLKWAQRLLKAKFFIVMTEKESAIAIDGADPFSFDDATALHSQLAELEMYRDSLEELISDHRTAIKRLTRGTRRARPTANRTKAQPVKSSSKSKATVRGNARAKAKN